MNMAILNGLKDAILKEIGVMESVPFPLNNTPYESHAASMTTALHTNADGQHSQRRKNTCLFCKGSHFSARCDCVTDSQQRLEIVKKEELFQLLVIELHYVHQSFVANHASRSITLAFVVMNLPDHMIRPQDLKPHHRTPLHLGHQTLAHQRKHQTIQILSLLLSYHLKL